MSDTIKLVPTVQESIKKMDAMVQCLYLACEKSVADEVFAQWVEVKRAIAWDMRAKP